MSPADGDPEEDPIPEPTPEPTPTEELWRLYKAEADLEVRQQLIDRYRPLVRFLAEHMSIKLPRSVDVDDLEQEGMFGLMDAIEKFEPERGFKFKTYCSTRVRGAILDSLRHQDWVPRLARSRSNKILKMREEFQNLHHREPTDEEIAEELGVKVKDVAKLNPKAIHNLSDRRVSPTLEGEGPMDSLGESREDNPLDFAHNKDMIDVITSTLSEKERSILHMYYIEGLTLAEVGSVLSITESRVCQIRSNVIKRLRHRLEKDSDQFHA